MSYNSDEYENLSGPPSPAEFPLGSDESRMAARAVVQGIGAPPNIQIGFVGPGVVKIDSHRATSGDREWLRADGESRVEFERRVNDDQVVGGFPKLIIFWPDQEEHVQV
jgi:hypothetical protein